MLGVEDMYALRRKVLVEGKSQRQVARKMGLARNTVRRYLATPVPEPRKRTRSRPVLERVRPRLEQLIEEWSERTTAKQRMTGRRLQRALREEGHEVGLTLVLEYLREWRRQRAEVYVPLVHRPGESAQVDFFEVTVELSGERRRAWLFLMRLMHSGRDFVRLYERQDQLAFLDGRTASVTFEAGEPITTYTLTTLAGLNGSISPAAGTHIYDEDTSVTVTAAPVGLERRLTMRRATDVRGWW